MSAQLESNDRLDEFRRWFLQHRVLRPPKNTQVVRDYGNIISNTIFREGVFQVELFTAKPNTEATDHIHPDMDSFEVYLGGDITFRAADVILKPSDPGQSIRVFPSCWHGATIGETGGIFLSVQHWLNGVEPSSAGENWTFRDNAQTEKAHPK